MCHHSYDVHQPAVGSDRAHGWPGCLPESADNDVCPSVISRCTSILWTRFTSLLQMKNGLVDWERDLGCRTELDVANEIDAFQHADAHLHA
jgi:hypothetical protein